jgi:hypothetical protein
MSKKNISVIFTVFIITQIFINTNCVLNIYEKENKYPLLRIKHINNKLGKKQANYSFSSNVYLLGFTVFIFFAFQISILNRSVYAIPMDNTQTNNIVQITNQNENILNRLPPFTLHNRKPLPQAQAIEGRPIIHPVNPNIPEHMRIAPQRVQRYAMDFMFRAYPFVDQGEVSFFLPVRFIKLTFGNRPHYLRIECPDWLVLTQPHSRTPWNELPTDRNWDVANDPHPYLRSVAELNIEPGVLAPHINDIVIQGEVGTVSYLRFFGLMQQRMNRPNNRNVAEVNNILNSLTENDRALLINKMDQVVARHMNGINGAGHVNIHHQNIGFVQRLRNILSDFIEFRVEHRVILGLNWVKAIVDLHLHLRQVRLNNAIENRVRVVEQQSRTMTQHMICNKIN